jgi:acyl carrier protein
MSDAVKDSVRDKVVAILAEQAMLDPVEVRAEATLAELGIDSLGLVEPKESEFDISTVDTMVRAVESLIAAQR